MRAAQVVPSGQPAAAARSPGRARRRAGARLKGRRRTSKGLKYLAETSSAYSMNSGSVFGTISSMFFPAPPKASRAAARSDSSTILGGERAGARARSAASQRWSDAVLSDSDKQHPPERQMGACVLATAERMLTSHSHLCLRSFSATGSSSS